MISKRPIYYTIIPSLVIIIGYIWYRRKRNGRVDCDTGGKAVDQSCKLLVEKEKLGDSNQLISSSSAYSTNSQQHQQQHSESLPITGTPQQQFKLSLSKEGSSPSEEDGGVQQSQSPGSSSSASSSTSSLCKSAPINIAPNPRSPPKRITEQDIDCEILKLKPQESDIKNLRRIEDPDSDSDLDDDEEEETPATFSPPYRSRFDPNRSQTTATEPVVLVKGTMEAKISPENSFRERKYTKTESDDSGRVNDSTSSTTTDKMTKQENGNISSNSSSCNINNNNNSNHNYDETSMNNSNDNGCVMQDDDEVTEATQMPTNKSSNLNNCNNININNTKSSTPTRTQQPQIASPSLSVCSMHSGDSGQGSSPPQSVGAPTITYEFLVPQICIGFIIGSRGMSIRKIKDKTGANVVIGKNVHGAKRQKVCTIEGTQSEVDAALKMIRSLIPDRKCYALNMERIFTTPDNKIMPTFNISSLQLIEEINNDVSIGTIVSGGHVFLQQPLHPSYPGLSLLQHRMNTWYTMSVAPELPDVIDNAICAYCIQDNWYRVQIVSHSSDTKMCVIKYLDFGGFANVYATELRQIHADFLDLPFQAIECVLSNIRPPNGQQEWSKESIETIHNFTNGVILQAQVAGYTPDDVPEVFLFVSITKDVSFSIIITI
jgi:A-kinase anchor protein 1